MIIKEIQSSQNRFDEMLMELSFSFFYFIMQKPQKLKKDPKHARTHAFLN